MLLCLIKQYINRFINFIKNRFTYHNKEPINNNTDITIISCKVQYIKQKETNE